MAKAKATAVVVEPQQLARVTSKTSITYWACHDFGIVLIPESTSDFYREQGYRIEKVTAIETRITEVVPGE